MSEVRIREVVGPGMRKLLVFVLVIFAVLVVDSVYLGAITFMQWLRDVELEGEIYQGAFLLHLALGFLLIVPAILFAGVHLARAIDRPNRLAVRLGLALFVVLVLLLASGVMLTRGIPLLEVNDELVRFITYWIHVITPLIVCWLFVLHRLAGPRIRWSVGGGILAVSGAIAVAGLWVADNPDRSAGVAADRYFFPSLARTSSGRFIPAQDLMRDEYCAGCHADIYDQWQHSAHRFASFNNPAYRFSVRNTRDVALERDGNVQAARFCAGCHDPVPLFSGAFDDPDFDDVNHPTAHAGITCVACHGIEEINSPRGNADYVIGSPEHYPFAFAESEVLQWVNGLLIKAKPALHKRTFLKPVHESEEFCGACHKVHLPKELNQYKWLRGQNHYDSFRLSGVSGHGVTSFYYPPAATDNCAACHMPLEPSTDLAASRNDDSGTPTVHNHQFPAANTALAHFFDLPDEVNAAHRKMLVGALRVDIFALREGAEVGPDVIAPLRPSVPTLEPGKTYVFDVVLRTLRIGHLFTEGTSDSNEVWLDVTVTSGGREIGRSGARDPRDGAVDPWSHFVNAYVLDRDGNRINRRNAEDIFTRLYNHQIPPGAADVVHYQFTVPEGIEDPIEIDVRLNYRKFDTEFMRLMESDAFVSNELPITMMASDQLVLPVAGEALPQPAPSVAAWERWNDYGIGFLRKPGSRALRPAEAAFNKVAALGRADGHLNLARVMLREGRLDEAADALRRAASDGAYPWSVTWFAAQVDLQNGELDAAIEGLRSLVTTQFAEARSRGFDFSLDDRLRNQLAIALFERAKLARSPAEEEQWLREAVAEYQAALALDPENLTAHYGIAQTYARLGEDEQAARHRTLHAEYRPDDNAHDRAVQIARSKNPAADHASEAIVIYDLQRTTSSSPSVTGR
jgi:tetratricopeptide (TPR) repeat protein